MQEKEEGETKDIDKGALDLHLNVYNNCQNEFVSVLLELKSK